MTVKQAAKHLELSYKSVYRLIGQGDLACQRIGPGRGKIVITEQDIAQYLASCECAASPAKPQERTQQYILMTSAHNVVTKAIRHGQLHRQPCEKCGNKKVHAHHEDYTKPLDVHWLCPKHHSQVHLELRHPPCPVATDPAPVSATDTTGAG